LIETRFGCAERVFLWVFLLAHALSQQWSHNQGVAELSNNLRATHKFR
jgi:hypothetical protein